MDWPNERYVRWYTRDTKTWMLLGWQGQCVFGLLIRKVDRAGVLDDVVDGADLAVVFANGMPVDEIQTGLDRLTKYHVVELTDAGAVLPNFIEAQETASSDKQRAKDSRERKRTASRIVTAKSRNVTVESRKVTPESQVVTGRHTASQDVTTCHSVLCCAVPSCAEKEIPPTPQRPIQKSPDRFGAAMTGQGPGDRIDVRKLHDAWRSAMGRTGATLRHATGDDAYALAEAIDSHSLPDCLLVATEAPRDGMVNGQLDKAKAKHESIRYIFGNEETFSRILASAKSKTQTPTGAPRKTFAQEHAERKAAGRLLDDEPATEGAQ
jgi:hypothetical protein